MNCYKAKAGELKAQWYVIDATEAVVGRLAAQIAPILMGKHRPTYTPYIDTGDYVVVTNVEKVVFTGKKWEQKFYQRYSGHPGGQKEEQALKLLGRHPDRILKLAIQRMMPKNKIGRHMMSKLKLVVGGVHEHQAQSPVPLAAIDGRPTSAGALFAPKVVAKPRRGRKKPVDVAPVDRLSLPTSSEPVATGSASTVVSGHAAEAPVLPAVESTESTTEPGSPVVESTDPTAE